MDTATELRRARHEALAPSESRFQAATRQHLHSLDWSDVIDELADCDDAMNAAMAKGDAALIGRIVLAVRAAYAARLANRELGEPYLLPWAQEVAARELVA